MELAHALEYERDSNRKTDKIIHGRIGTPLIVPFFTNI